jgi:hypothetical protein
MPRWNLSSSCAEPHDSSTPYSHLHSHLIQVREKFANRKDKLKSRVVEHREGKTRESFEPGRTRALKELLVVEVRLDNIM